MDPLAFIGDMVCASDVNYVPLCLSDSMLLRSIQVRHGYLYLISLGIELFLCIQDPLPFSPPTGS